MGIFIQPNLNNSLSSLSQNGILHKMDKLLLPLSLRKAPKSPGKRFGTFSGSGSGPDPDPDLGSPVWSGLLNFFGDFGRSPTSGVRLGADC